MEKAETILVLRHLRKVWKCKSVDDMKKRIKWIVNDYFPSKELGSKDETSIQIFKGAIKESRSSCN